MTASTSVSSRKIDLSYASSDVSFTQKGQLFRPDRDYLLGELKKITSTHIPENYFNNILRPLINLLETSFNQHWFKEIFSKHIEDLSNDEAYIKQFFPTIVEAFLQRNYKGIYYESTYNDLQSFQAVVDAIHNKSIFKGPLPPLVAWSPKIKGPSTITSQKFEKVMDIIHKANPKPTYHTPLIDRCGLVCLPPEYCNGGLLAWSMMGHEVAGHNFIQEKPRLIEDIINEIKTGFIPKIKGYLTKHINDTTEKEKELEKYQDIISNLLSYWTQAKRIEEITSDILGILSTGPSFAIGYIGYARGISQGLLRTDGPFEVTKSDSLRLHSSGQNIITLNNVSEKVSIQNPSSGIIGKDSNGRDISFNYEKNSSGHHPVQALRPFAMAEAIRHTDLNARFKGFWMERIEEQLTSNEFKSTKCITFKKIQGTNKTPFEIPFETAAMSAKIIAGIICSSKFPTLMNGKLSDYYKWGDKEESVVIETQKILTTEGEQNLTGKSAIDIVAAATIEASYENAEIEQIFKKMKACLFSISK